MLRFLAASIFSFLLWLIITTGSGNLLLWSKEEIIIGALLSLLLGGILRNTFFEKNMRMINPARWFLFVVYLFGPFLWALIKANIDVAYRVLSMNIRPGIVRISPGITHDLAITMLANSITLTPGTLTVEVDEQTSDIYVHSIAVKDEALEKMPRQCEDICDTKFVQWAKRVAE